MVRLAADSIISGVWIADAATVVLVGAMTLPIGLGARMLSMVKSDVGDDMVAEEPPGREETDSRGFRCRGAASPAEPIGLLANVLSSRAASVSLALLRLAVAAM